MFRYILDEFGDYGANWSLKKSEAEKINLVLNYEDDVD